MIPVILASFLASIGLSLYSVNMFSSILHNSPVLTLILTISLYIPFFSTMFLLPIDIITSSSSTSSSIKPVIMNLWRLNYWLGFFLTWFILPLFQSYYSSHNFLFKNRLRDSLIYNLKFYSAYLVIATLGLIYVFFSIGLSVSSIRSLVILLSHSYSLLLVIWFMGHGLINLAKIYIWDSMVIQLNDQYFIDHYYSRLLIANQQFSESKNCLNDVIQLICKLETIKDSQNSTYHMQWISYLYNALDSKRMRIIMDNNNSSLHNNLTNYNNRFNQDLSLLHNQMSDKFLMQITKSFKDSYYNFAINEFVYYSLLQKIIRIQDIKTSKQEKSLTFRIFLPPKFLKNSPKLTFQYYYNFIPFLLKCYSVILVLLSSIVIISELLHRTSFSPINLILTRISDSLTFIISTILITVAYMCTTALISLSKFKIFLMYKLILKNSNPASCIWYASYAIRLSFPICYNFLTLLNSRDISNIFASSFTSHSSANDEKNNITQFAIFMGDSINFITFGKSFNDWLPYFILVPIIIQLHQILKSNQHTRKNMSLNSFSFNDNQNSPMSNAGESYNDFNDRTGGGIFGRINNFFIDFKYLLIDEDEDDYEESTTSAALLPASNQSNLIQKVERLINYETTNSGSLLHNYDNNYFVFYSSSLKFCLASVFGNGGLQVGEDNGDDNNGFYQRFMNFLPGNNSGVSL